MTAAANDRQAIELRNAFDVEQALLPLPGSPEQWIWTFTCPKANCACREAVVVTAAGSRDSVRERGQPVAAAWRSGDGYARAASELEGVITFAVDLDTLEVFSLAGDPPLDPVEHPDVGDVVKRFDDGLLDRIAELWFQGKGRLPPVAPAEGGAAIPIEDWRPGDMVIWDDVQPSPRRDLYVFGERMFEAIELYCVEAGCDARHVVVDFDAVAPRGAPFPGHVEMSGATATLYPAGEQHRGRLAELWDAYCGRHSDHADRFVRRCSAMHELAGRIVAAPPKPKFGRNDPCPCGSGKKHKKCCGAA